MRVSLYSRVYKNFGRALSNNFLQKKLKQQIFEFIMAEENKFGLFTLIKETIDDENVKNHSFRGSEKHALTSILLSSSSIITNLKN